NWELAEKYAYKTLEYNTYNLNARQLLLILHRKNKQTSDFDLQLRELMEIDPLNHFATIESQFKLDNKNLTMPLTIQNEFPEETILSLAIYYHSLGFDREAVKVLELSKTQVKNKLWSAFLAKDEGPAKSDGLLRQLIQAPIDFIFPYRSETISVLEWAHSKVPHWKIKYYLAQNYISVGQKNKGIHLLKACGNEPDSDIFYRFRAKILVTEGYADNEKDYLKALRLKTSDWKIWEEFIQFYLQNDKNEAAYKLAGKAYSKFNNNANIGLIYAKSSLLTGKYGKTIEVLENISILPFEHASESKKIYSEAHILSALEHIKNKKYHKAIQLLEASKAWPENLGVG